MTCKCSKCGATFDGNAMTTECLPCLGVSLPITVGRMGIIVGSDKTELRLNEMGSYQFVGWMLGAASHNPKIKKEVEKFLNHNGHLLEATK